MSDKTIVIDGETRREWWAGAVRWAEGWLGVGETVQPPESERPVLVFHKTDGWVTRDSMQIGGRYFVPIGKPHSGLCELLSGGAMDIAQPLSKWVPGCDEMQELHDRVPADQ